MSSFVDSCEIIEVKESSSVLHSQGAGRLKSVLNSGCADSLEDLNKLFSALNLKASYKGSSPSRQENAGLSWKNAEKKPMKVDSPHSVGIGVSEPISLKQALRGLSISQASEMAAMKRISKLKMKDATKSVLVEPSEASFSIDEVKSVVEISEKMHQHHRVDNNKLTNKSAPSSPVTTARIKNLTKMSNKTIHASIDIGSQTLKSILLRKEMSNVPNPVRKARQKTPSSSSSSNWKITNSTHNKTPHLAKTEMTKNFVHDDNSNQNSYLSTDNHALKPSASQLVCERCQRSLNDANVQTDIKSPLSISSSTKVDSVIVKHGSSTKAVVHASKNTKQREKGEFSNSSKSSLGEYSTTTSFSEESNISRSSCSNRPHMSKDERWKAIRHVRLKHRILGLEHFNLLKKLGCGDIGTVYLAELIGSDSLFAIKVMDNEYLKRRKKMPRAHTEREILKILDHPFLPTLYAHFTSDNLSCLVMEYCPDGDLHVLRQRQPGRKFPEHAARFYAAEVLLALEYLHMLGVIYRDLKPENILVRDDGHIMLTDFDLSLICTVNPTLLKSASTLTQTKIVRVGSSCINPLCIEPSCRVPCFSPRFLHATSRVRRVKSENANQIQSLPQLVAEPTSARSNSFVGTHEYLAPEIIREEGHGSAVDWWTFGIFLYELLYGRTPFKGPCNEDTLANVVSRNVKFPDCPSVGFHARDMIGGLLMKDPENRLGSEKGAAEIKQHPFFAGLNWALIRCEIPPEIPNYCDMENKNGSKFLEYMPTGEQLEFEMF